MSRERTRALRRASAVAVAGNAVLALAKVSVGLVSGTLSVLGDGLDSTLDIVTSGIPFFTARVLQRKPNASFPFGYGRAEATASTVLAFAIFYAGMELAVDSVRRLVDPPSFGGISALAVAVTLVSLVGKILLAWQQRRAGRRLKSVMLKANAKNMIGDITISAGVLTGLALGAMTGSSIIDPLVTLIISALIIRTSVGLFIESNRELMDGVEDTETYGRIAQLAGSVDGVGKPHRMRLRKSGLRWVVYLDIEVPGSWTVERAHRVATEVENRIHEGLDDVYDVIVHIEPEGNRQPEAYGVSMEGKD